MFTSNQIQEILNKLKLCGVKDTHFSRAQSVNLTDDIAIVQNNRNKILSVQKLLDCFEDYISGSTSGNSDFFNVSKYGMIASSATTPVAYTLEDAVAACPDAVKYSGQVVTFLNSTNNKWYGFQYTDSNINNWSTLSKWNQIFPNIITEEDPIFTHSPAAQLTQQDIDKLSGIEAGAQKNVQSDWNEADSNSDAYIKNKPQSFVSVVVPSPIPVLNFGQTITIASIDGTDIKVEMPQSSSPASAQKLTLTMGSSTLGEYNPFDSAPTTIDIPTVGGASLAVWPEFSGSAGDKLAEIRYGDLNNNPQSFSIYSNTKKTISIKKQPVQGCSPYVTPKVYIPNGTIQGTSVVISADENDYKAGGDGTYVFKNWDVSWLVFDSGLQDYSWISNSLYGNPCVLNGTGEEIKVTAVYEQIAYTFEWLTDWSQYMSSDDSSFPYTYTLNKNGSPDSTPLYSFIKTEVNNNLMDWQQIGELITGIGSYTDANNDVWTVSGQSSIISPSMWEDFLLNPNAAGLKDSSKIYCILENIDTASEVQYITLFKYVNINNPYDKQLMDRYAGNYLLAGMDEGWLVIAKMPKTIDNIEQSSIGYFIEELPVLAISYDTLNAWIGRFSGNNAFLIVANVPGQ